VTIACDISPENFESTPTKIFMAPLPQQAIGYTPQKREIQRRVVEFVLTPVETLR
jgi:hypothetical protein